MTDLVINTKCSRCGGSGVDENVDPVVPCTSCNATGYVPIYSMDISVIMNELDWIKSKIKKILKKLDIEE